MCGIKKEKMKIKINEKMKNKKVNVRVGKWRVVVSMPVAIAGLVFVLVVGIGTVGALNGWFGGGGRIPEDTMTRGLVGYWNFDEGSGSTVYDNSGNGKNGAINTVWLTGWDYRKAVSINASIDGALTDYQMPIKVYRSTGTDSTESLGSVTAGKVYVGNKCESDYNDIRITKSDGMTLLDYWIEDTDTNSESALIWVEVDSIPISGSVGIYVYYGKTDAVSQSDGDATFPLFDHFLGDSLDTDKWTSSETGGTLTIADSFITAHKNGDDANAVRINSVATYGVNYAARTRLKSKYVNSSSYQCITYWSNSNEYIISGWTSPDSSTNYKFRQMTASPALSATQAIVGVSADVFFVHDSVRLSDGSGDFYINNANKTSITGVKITGSINFRPISVTTKNNSEGVVDWTFIRKNTNNAPTWGTWENEESQYFIIWAQGKKGLAGNFDGTNNYLSVGNVYDGVKTVEFWIKADNTTQKIIDLNGTEYVEVSGGAITATGWTSPTIYVDGVATSMIDADWHHVVITTNTGINTSAVDFGRVSADYFDGRLDEIRFYNRALSQTEVRYHYNEGGPVAHWKFDEGNGTTTYNSVKDNRVWLDGYSYRKSMTIQNSTTTDQTDYQMMLVVNAGSGTDATGTVYLSSHGQSDFDDLRFTTSDGLTELDYWVESTTTASSTVWIEFDSLSASASTTFYMYYGNDGAESVSNGINTFGVGMFDDFEWGSDGDDIDTSGGNVTWTKVLTGSGSSKIDTGQKWSGSRSVQDIYDGGVAQAATVKAGGSDYAIQFRVRKSSTGAVAWVNGYNNRLLYSGIGWDEKLFYYNASNANTTIKTGIAIDTWHLIEINDINWTSYTYDLWLNGVKEANNIAMSSYVYNDGIKLDCDYSNSGAGSGWYDNLIIRKWVATEPVFGSWGPEEGVMNGILGDGTCEAGSGTCPAWTTGKNGTALSFDGTDDYVQAVVSQSTTTVSFWMENNGVWQYITNVNGTYYINGKKSSSAPNYFPIYFSGTTLYIGKTGASSYFNGKIDDVRIYNYVRTNDEIKLDYNSGFGARFGPQSSCDDDPGACMTNGLVGYWNFDEGSASTVYDTSGNGKNGTINTAWLTGYNYRKNMTIQNSTTTDQTDYQLKLIVNVGSGTDATDTVYLSSHGQSDFDDLRFTTSDGQTELDYWVESTTTASSTVWIEFDSLPASASATFYMYYGNPDVGSASNGDDTFILFDDFTGDSLDADKWDNLTGVSVSDSVITIVADADATHGLYSKTAFGLGHAYRARVKPAHLSGSTYYEATGFYDIDDSHNTYTYWCCKVDESLSGYFNTNFGTASKIAIAGATADTWMVLDVLRPTNAHALFYIDNANEKEITTNIPNDDIKIRCIAYGNNSKQEFDWILIRKIIDNEPIFGSWGSEEEYSGATFSQGSSKKGTSLSFNGTNENISIGDVYDGVKTVEFWVKADSTTKKIIDLNGTEYVEVSGGTITATGWTSPTIYVDGVATTTIDTDWHHVVITSNTGINASAVDFGRVSSDYFDGNLDEIRFYNRALSQTEVRYHYNGGGPVVYWKFDEGMGSVAYDSSGMGNNGTMGFSWLEGYSYRKSFTVQNATDTDLSNYQMKLIVNVGSGTDATGTVYLSSHGQSDFDDLRFTTSDGLTELDYWIESTTTASSTVWIELDSLPASASTNFYMYYGNVGASAASNGSNTFIFFDDFPGSSLDTNKWTSHKYGTNSSITVSGGEVIVKAWCDKCNAQIISKESHEFQDMMEVRAKITQGTNDLHFISRSTAYSTPWGYGESVPSGVYLSQRRYTYSGGPYQRFHSKNSSTSYVDTTVPLSTWNIIGLFSNGAISQFWRDYSLINEIAGSSYCPSLNTTSTISLLSFSFATTLQIEADWVRVRNYMSDEPSWEEWGSEASSVPNPSWANGKNGNALNFNENNYVKATLSQGTTTVSFWMKQIGSDWQHVANVNGTYYINGKKSSSAPSVYPIYFSGNDIYVGIASNSTFEGIIDDVRVYDYARTQAQIQLDYNAGFGARFGPQSSCDDDPGACMTNGLVGYWNFDEGTGQTAYDGSDHSNNGQLGSTTDSDSGDPTWAKGKQGLALSFDGTNDYVTANDIANYLSPLPFTLSAWVYPNSVQRGALFSFHSSGSNRNLFFWVEDGSTAKFSHCDGVDDCITSSDAFEAGSWYHIIWRINSDGTGSIFVNGEEQATWLTSNSNAGSINQFSIGQEWDGASASDFFDGQIDEVRVYDRALSETEIRYHYNKGGPVAYWKFNEGEGDIAYDSSGNGNSGTLFGGMATSTEDHSGWKEGKYGTALAFDGIDDYVSISNNSSLTCTTQFSYEVFIKMNRIPSSYGPLGYRLNGNSLYPRLEIKNNGTVLFQYRINGSTKSINPSIILSTGEWYHIAGTIDVEKGGKLYINGVEVGSSSATGTSIDGGSSSRLIGYDSNLSSWFEGIIDDVRIYNYARTPEKIQQDYNAGYSIYFK